MKNTENTSILAEGRFIPGREQTQVVKGLAILIISSTLSVSCFISYKNCSEKMILIQAKRA